jgi:hypothetical protein
MRTALAMLAAALLLTGCGHVSAAKDPFVGIWQGLDVHLVIAKAGKSYRTTLVVPVKFPHGNGWVGPYTRKGNELKAGLSVTLDGKPTGRVIVELIDFVPTTGRLTYKDGTGPAIEFSRVSASTAIPTPSPS